MTTNFFFRKYFLFVLFIFTNIYADDAIVISTQELQIPSYPRAYNPSIVNYRGKKLLSFRYQPSRLMKPWISYIGLVSLDDDFKLNSSVTILNVRNENNKTPSQAEDARLFVYQDRLYVIYNDNDVVTAPYTWQRRDIFIAEVLDTINGYELTLPQKLIHQDKYDKVAWQKNWSPFIYNNQLLLIYSITPHEIILPNLKTGISQTVEQTTRIYPNIWPYGPLRGGTPAELIDGEYLTFFHSGICHATEASHQQLAWHYYMGAYTFENKPPFKITKISKTYIDHPSFYTKSDCEKRVIYPGGFLIDDDKKHITLVYGKDDCKICIGKISISELKKSLCSTNN